jgi:hypothetical protein
MFMSYECFSWGCFTLHLAERMVSYSKYLSPSLKVLGQKHLPPVVWVICFKQSLFGPATNESKMISFETIFKAAVSGYVPERLSSPSVRAMIRSKH